MGTGKSTVGKILAEKIKLPFYDTDAIVTSELKISIGEIFKSQGEDIFREYERAVLDDLLAYSTPGVIALGGGALVDDSIRHRVRESGILIAFFAEPYQIIDRLNQSQIESLLIMSGKSVELAQDREIVLRAISELIQKRQIIYDDYDFSISTGERQISDIIDEIIKKMEFLLAY